MNKTNYEFTKENTEGYTTSELNQLNNDLRNRSINIDENDDNFDSEMKNLCERVLSDFDNNR